MVPVVMVGASQVGVWTAPVAAIAFVWVAVTHTKAGGRGPSTRLAAQMGAALAVAFVVGHVALGEHWSWVVLTVFLVGSGNRGRGDVLDKSVLRGWLAPWWALPSPPESSGCSRRRGRSW